jgi:hypothetical protein
MAELALSMMLLAVVTLVIGMNEAFKKRDGVMIVSTMFSFVICTYGVIQIIKEIF